MSAPDSLEDALGMSPPAETLCRDCAHIWPYSKCRAFPTTKCFVTGGQSYGPCAAKNNGHCPDFKPKGFDWPGALTCLLLFIAAVGIVGAFIWPLVTGGAS